MRRLFTTPRFEKRLAAFLDNHPTLLTDVQTVMQTIAENPRAPALRTHRLSGTLAGCLAARLAYEYRIVFVLAADRVTFIDIGTHDDVYR